METTISVSPENRQKLRKVRILEISRNHLNFLVFDPFWFEKLKIMDNFIRKSIREVGNLFEFFKDQ